MNAPPIADRLARIHERIAAAVARRGDGPSVQLLAVSKRQPLAAIEAALAAGQCEFGENYAQELRAKRQDIHDTRVRWHFIGALQSNKIPLVLGTTLIHTVDRPSLLAAMETRAATAGVVQDVLVEVNVADEASKAGVTAAALPGLLDAFADLQHVRCRGLMTIPPADTPQATRPHFAALRQLAERMAQTPRPGVVLRELSMGMSADYDLAIEEGATIVRVGTAVFGARPVAG